MQLRLRLDAKRRKFDRTKSRPPQLSAKVLMKSETQTTWPFCEGIHTALPSHCILYIQNHTKRGWALCIVIFVDGSIVDSDIYVSQVAFLWSLFSGLFFSLFLLDYLYSLLSSQISKRGYQSGFIYFGRINWLLTNSIDNLCQYEFGADCHPSGIGIQPIWFFQIIDLILPSSKRWWCRVN